MTSVHVYLSELAEYPLLMPSVPEEEILTVFSVNTAWLRNRAQYINRSDYTALEKIEAKLSKWTLDWENPLLYFIRETRQALLSNVTLNDLPSAVFEVIFNHVSFKDAVLVRRVSKRIRKSTYDPIFLKINSEKIQISHFFIFEKLVKFQDALQIIQANKMTVVNLTDISNPDSFELPAYVQQLIISNFHSCTENNFIQIGQLRNLTYLQLSSIMYLTPAMLEHLAPLTNLRQLHFDYCAARDITSWQALTNLTGLREFRLSHLTVGRFEIGKQLEGLTHLETLRCWGLFINDDDFVHLQKLTNLRCLDLQECRMITDNGLPSLSQFTHLEVLDLSRCGRITKEGMMAHLSNTSYTIINTIHRN